MQTAAGTFKSQGGNNSKQRHTHTEGYLTHVISRRGPLSFLSRRIHYLLAIVLMSWTPPLLANSHKDS